MCWLTFWQKWRIFFFCRTFFFKRFLALLQIEKSAQFGWNSLSTVASKQSLLLICCCQSRLRLSLLLLSPSFHETKQQQKQLIDYRTVYSNSASKPLETSCVGGGTTCILKYKWVNCVKLLLLITTAPDEEPSIQCLLDGWSASKATSCLSAGTYTSLRRRERACIRLCKEGTGALFFFFLKLQSALHPDILVWLVWGGNSSHQKHSPLEVPHVRWHQTEERLVAFINCGSIPATLSGSFISVRSAQRPSLWLIWSHYLPTAVRL